MPPGALESRVALVTGCGSERGIGFAIARRLARDGAALAIGSTTDRIAERAEELRDSGAAAVGLVADLTDPGGPEGLFAAAEAELGPVEILVNNAGMAQTGTAERSAPVSRLDPDEWDRQMAISLRTCFAMTRLALPGMIGRGWGRIVNVSSVTGPLLGDSGQGAYAAAKAGMDGLMRTVAVESAGDGVTANSVAPGWIETASSPPHEIEAGRATPSGRPGTPAEVAAAVAFLCSPEASYVNGHSLVVDGANSVEEDHAAG